MKRIILLVVVAITAILCCNAQKKGEHYQATIKTSMGNIVIRLYNDTPLHRDNFVKLAEENFYQSILFHRVIDDFMIQCGDPDTQISMMTKQYGGNDVGYKIPSEIVPDHHHYIGAVAAAREGDSTNPERKSSGSQFYIVIGQKNITNETFEKADRAHEKAGVEKLSEEIKKEYRKRGGAPHLDGAYTIFGEVVKGIEVANLIAKEKTDRYDRPIDDVYIKAIDIKMVKD